MLSLRRATTPFARVAGSATSTSAAAQPPVIRVPRRAQERAGRGSSGRVATTKPGRTLISCKLPQFNQSAGFTPGRFEETRLCSRGWKHSRSSGDHFTVNSTRAVAHDAGPREPTFGALRVHADLVEALRRAGVVRPTWVQRQLVPKLLRGHNVLCAAETGSGKTLAYLLPVLHRLREAGRPEPDAETRAAILVPSRELADQVASVARALGRPVGLTVGLVGGGRGVGAIKAAFAGGRPDVLVATPGALLKALWRNYVRLDALNFVVVDEADTMFDPSFSGMLGKVLTQTHISENPSDLRGPTPKAQLVVVGATFPGGVGDVLDKVTDLGSMLTIRSQMLHFLLPHVKQTFLKVKGADKLLELSEALKRAEREGAAVLVFCNSASTVNWLGYSLGELGVRHARLQGGMPAAMREGVFRSFQKGLASVLVCTDIASRGLDTQRVRLVVNYDFPETQTDYIHRVGRVGRAGGQMEGEALSFVTHPWDVELVQKIEAAARKRTCLPGMETGNWRPGLKAATDN
ncbi:putative ATP-dependent RNA helicase DDX28 [Denticeps clupeoides]|uniref:ATP-dependent RNA helicase n=1 Tax=Denticeps clupeoides TaxID=299321 RepID=A0AAY4F0L3_9TELE|nr:probable ATP-dependent RNA helicase DDX28 [Denticeps clupeoides]